MDPGVLAPEKLVVTMQHGLTLWGRDWGCGCPGCALRRFLRWLLVPCFVTGKGCGAHRPEGPGESHEITKNP